MVTQILQSSNSCNILRWKIFENICGIVMLMWHGILHCSKCYSGVLSSEVTRLSVGWKVSREMVESGCEAGTAQEYHSWGGVCTGTAWRGKPCVMRHFWKHLRNLSPVMLYDNYTDCTLSVFQFVTKHYWLPVCQQMLYKVAATASHCVHGTGRAYFQQSACRTQFG